MRIKQISKISTIVLASAILISGSGAFLANSFNAQQNAPLINYQLGEVAVNAVQDSEVVYKKDIPDKYTSMNIGDLFIESDGYHIDKNVLGDLIDLTYFPEGTSFRIEVSGFVFDYAEKCFAGYFVSDKYYKNGVVISEVMGWYDIKFYGIKIVLDSKVFSKNISSESVYFGTPNIDEYFGNGVVKDSRTLNDIVELENFPDDTVYTINGVVINDEEGTYDSFLIPDKYYDEGILKTNVAEQLKSYPINLIHLPTAWFFNSLAEGTGVHEGIANKYFLDNITDLLGTTPINLDNFREVASLFRFPTGATYTISNVNIDYDLRVYTSDLIPSAFYEKGIIIQNSGKRTFPIEILGMKGFKKSKIINRAIPKEFILGNVQDSLKAADGFTINKDVLGKLIYLAGFPSNTTFYGDFENSIINHGNQTYTLNVSADKQFIDGNDTAQVSNYELILDFYEAPAQNQVADNTGLIVGLAVGAVSLALIIGGLVIWNKKRTAAAKSSVGKTGKV